VACLQLLCCQAASQPTLQCRQRCSLLRQRPPAPLLQSLPALLRVLMLAWLLLTQLQALLLLLLV
jgi:hypothetical protein